MEIHVQMTTTPAADWQAIEAVDWSALPKLLEPVGGETINATPGWVYGLNVQGVVFHADHYAVEQKSAGIVIYHWNDDPEDFAPEDMWGKTWAFSPMFFDRRYGRYNTRQFCVYYGGDNVLANLPLQGIQATGGTVLVRHFSEFPYPDEAIVRHGIWMSDQLVVEHDTFNPAPLASWELDRLPDTGIEPDLAGLLIGGQ